MFACAYVCACLCGHLTPQTSIPSPPESRSMVSATTTMGLRSTWARTNTWNSSRLSYTGSSELSTLETQVQVRQLYYAECYWDRWP